MAITARTIILRAFDSLGVFAPGQSVPNADVADAFARLNAMISGWAQQPLTIPAVSIETFDLAAGRGSLADPYLIGTGATGSNFNTQKPANQGSIGAASLVLVGTDPLIEIPYAIMTDDSYASIQIKSLASTYFTALWYNPTYLDGFGRIYLWPVPNTSDYDIRLYIKKHIAQFADVNTTSYTFPDGYEEAFEYNLCLRLSAPYKQPVPGEVRKLAVQSLANIKRPNTKLTDMPIDPALTGNARGVYNILTGTGGSN